MRCFKYVFVRECQALYHIEQKKKEITVFNKILMEYLKKTVGKIRCSVRSLYANEKGATGLRGP